MSIVCTKEKSKLIFKDENGRTGTYDLADQSCYNYQGRKVKSLNSFFANRTMFEITWSDSNYAKFVHSIRRRETRLRNVGSMLSQLHYYRHNEGYILLGLPVSGIMNKPISDYPKAVRKFLINKFQHTGDSWSFKQWLRFFNDTGTEKLRLIQMIDQLDLSHIFSDCGTYEFDIIFGMSTHYNMDLKSLLLKINDYVRGEGLTFSSTLSNLRDYNRMSKAMTTKYQKYPKYLLSTHQIVVKNYNAFKETYEEQAFINQVDKKLSHKGVSYSILTPTKSQDVKDEGATLHHCVASYVKTIINGTTQIVFMRSNKQLDKPLLTIEINNGKIQQAKGTYNRAATEDELKFINTYAKAKNLGISNYL